MVGETCVSPPAGHPGPDVGGPRLLHRQAVLVEVPVHVGGVLCHHQLRHLQSHAQTAVLQDAQVRTRIMFTRLKNLNPAFCFTSYEHVKDKRQQTENSHPGKQSGHRLKCWTNVYTEQLVYVFTVTFLQL